MSEERYEPPLIEDDDIGIEPRNGVLVLIGGIAIYMVLVTPSTGTAGGGGGSGNCCEFSGEYYFL